MLENKMQPVTKLYFQSLLHLTQDSEDEEIEDSSSDEESDEVRILTHDIYTFLYISFCICPLKFY